MRLTCRSLFCARVAVFLPTLAIWSTAALLPAATFWPTAVHADEQVPSGDVARDQLGRVIAVLRLQPAAAGQSCLDALHEVHQTEDQVKVLQNKTNNPDLPLAQDVLETDYENAKEICGADAGRLCANPEQVKGMDASCGALHQGSRSR